MKKCGEAFVGIDTAKARNAVAVAEAARDGEVRYLGEIDNTVDAAAKLVRSLSGRYAKLYFCYEAGPTGYGLYRQLRALGQDCIVVAPSLIPSRPGERVKTNRRDAMSLARLLRANELTPVWVPDETHEAVRDLARTRCAAVADYRRKRQQLSSFLLRHDRRFPGKPTWRGRYLSLAGRPGLCAPDSTPSVSGDPRPSCPLSAWGEAPHLRLGRPVRWPPRPHHRLP